MIQTEIHDFFTGLNYTYDRKLGTCQISKLTSASVDSQVDADGHLIIRDPSQFFDLDANNFQYVGLVNDFLCLNTRFMFYFVQF